MSFDPQRLHDMLDAVEREFKSSAAENSSRHPQFDGALATVRMAVDHASVEE